ncbi:MAG: 30S ribosomal protein S16 [Parcubacteria group bacterium]|nr:30S ribosomal protein S16 [Parcubacteria group bacterium]
MLKIRLRRVGKKKQPNFRVVLTEEKNKVKGKYIEELGFYNPAQNVLNFKKERVEYWASKGAQMSETVFHLFKKAKK